MNWIRQGYDVYDPDEPETGEVSRDSLPNDMRDALRAIQDPAYMRTPRYELQQWRATREGGHLLIREFEKAFIKRMKALNVPMYCHCMVRTPNEQGKVFVGGFSNNDGTKPYPHRHCAVDIVHSVFQWGMTKQQWQIIGHIGKEVAKVRGIDITWGGGWNNPYDPAHWQLREWREREKEVLQ